MVKIWFVGSVLLVYFIVHQIGCTRIKSFYAITGSQEPIVLASYVCEENGLLLATIESEEEERFLEHHLKEAQFDSEIEETFFVNGRRILDTNKFIWDTTPITPINYTKWHNNEPRYESYENCLAISKRDGEYGWTSEFCLTRYHFICMKYTEEDKLNNSGSHIVQ